MAKGKLHIDSGKRRGQKLKRGELLTLCDRRVPAALCGDPFAGQEVCRRCLQDRRYPSLVAERFMEGVSLHSVCFIWWRGGEPEEMCGDRRNSLLPARAERRQLLWDALSRGLPKMF